MIRRSIRLLVLVFSLAALPAFGQEDQSLFDVSASIDWVRGLLSMEASFNLAQAGIKLPTGRLAGEELLNDAYPGLLRQFLLSLKVDSSATVKTLIDRGDLSLGDLDVICAGAVKIPPGISSDLTRMTGKYTISLANLCAYLNRNKTTAEPATPLLPVPAAEYSGIIIIADNVLPIHGRKTQTLVEPCLFPKIWDSDMNLVYDRNIFSPASTEIKPMVSYTTAGNIFRSTPSGLEGDLAALAGPKPLRIIAREVFGISPTDPVIDREDALSILSTENNRRLLREGRVIVVLDASQLTRAKL